MSLKQMFGDANTRALVRLFCAMQQNAKDDGETTQVVDVIGTLKFAKLTARIGNSLGDVEAAKLIVFCHNKIEMARLDREDYSTKPELETLRQKAQAGLETIAQSMNPKTRQLLISAELWTPAQQERPAVSAAPVARPEKTAVSATPAARPD